MVNALILQGRLTKDVVNKNGTAQFSIAFEDYKNETMFIDVVAFKQTAEYCFNYLHKGNMVIIDGSLRINKYQDKIYISCVARKITSIGSSNKETNFIKEERQAKEDLPVATEKEIDLDDPQFLDLPF